MPEIIQNGINGFIVSSVDEMADRIKDIMNISREGCRKSVESRFSQERMVKEYIEVYKEILSYPKVNHHRLVPPELEAGACG
jgi:glycosyltransferase involved in cell wall biosynthesis